MSSLLEIFHSDEERLAFLHKQLLAASFQEAKSMPENPHSYTLRKNWASDEDFCRAVLLIRQFSYTERFRGRYYKIHRFTHPDGSEWKYWTMGDPVLPNDVTTYNGNTILINRKAVGVDGEGR